MNWSPTQILEMLDRCCATYSFPMLDNGYVYLAASRLTAFRSPTNWAFTVEVFGYSPRAGLPETKIYTFASRFENRDETPGYFPEQQTAVVAQHPHDQLTFVFPLKNPASWLSPECEKHVARKNGPLLIRGTKHMLPAAAKYPRLGIELSEPPKLHVFELCRALAVTHRADILATEVELRRHLPPELAKIGELDAWNHPDVATGLNASSSETFCQLAEILCGRDFSEYRPPAHPTITGETGPRPGRSDGGRWGALDEASSSSPHHPARPPRLSAITSAMPSVAGSPHPRSRPRLAAVFPPRSADQRQRRRAALRLRGLAHGALRVGRRLGRRGAARLCDPRARALAVAVTSLAR